jgi:hypothetical protein
MAGPTENESDADISALDDKVFEAWVDAFMYPSDEAVEGLLRLCSKNDVSAIVEAVRIARKKRDLQDDDARLKYVGGILRNKRLEATSPELALRLRNVRWLTKHWKNQPRGTGYLPVWTLSAWLKDCTPEEIRAVMDLTGGIYSELRNEVGALIESKSLAAAAKGLNSSNDCCDPRIGSEFEAREQQEYTEALELSSARAEARGILPQPCLAILRNHPNGATARTICAELERAGIDLSCYKKPVSAIGAVLKQIPGVKNTRKRRSNGTVRAYYEIEALDV